MKLREKIWIVFSIWWLDIKSMPKKAKRRIWNKHILLRWHRLWVRKDEFHSSLSMDPAAMFGMEEREVKKYFKDLIRRRDIAHQRDLDND